MKSIDDDENYIFFIIFIEELYFKILLERYLEAGIF